MQPRYFVHHDNRHLGPFTFEEIELKQSRNELFPTDYVYVNEARDWMPMLEFIMVHGPRQKLNQGARTQNDARLDWQRYQAGIPAGAGLTPPTQVLVHEERKASDIYPPPPPAEALGFVAPPPPPPQVRVKAKPAIASPPQVQSVAPPVVPASDQKPKRAPFRYIDTSAKAKIQVLPVRATKLDIQITGEARIGEELEIVVLASDEDGAIDATFEEMIYIYCDRPMMGLEPLRFQGGIARLKVHCVTEGIHEFSLSLKPIETAANRGLSELSPLTH